MRKSNRPERFLLLLIPIMLTSLFFTSCGEPTSDPRYPDLKAAMHKMTNDVAESDSLTNTMKSIFGLASMDGFNTESFTYYTEIKEDKTLILVKIPELNSVQLSDRDVFLSLADKMSDTEDPYMKRYIGIFGRRNLMLCKTPSEEFNSSKLSKSLLYDFFGPKPTSE